MKPRRMTRADLVRAIADQQKFIEERGGSMGGYVARYGSAVDVVHYGNGGEAIYRADVNVLRCLELALGECPVAKPNVTAWRASHSVWIMADEAIVQTRPEADKMAAHWRETGYPRPEYMVRVGRFLMGPRAAPIVRYTVRAYARRN